MMPASGASASAASTSSSIAAASTCRCAGVNTDASRSFAPMNSFTGTAAQMSEVMARPMLSSLVRVGQNGGGLQYGTRQRLTIGEGRHHRLPERDLDPDIGHLVHVGVVDDVAVDQSIVAM